MLIGNGEKIMTKPLSLVTGAAGFIGSNLTDYLIKQGHQVICVDNKSADNDLTYLIYLYQSFINAVHSR